jgi:hypothetical protein
MATTNDGVRSLTQADLDWVLDVGAARRERIVSYAPTLWRPAANVREVHGRFLRDQIDDPDVVSIRTDHGFLFGAAPGDLLVVDDMALEDESAWDTDGQRLLHAAGERSDVRLVCPVPERARTRAAVALGMTNAESWWHRDLVPNLHGAPRDDPSLSAAGASGRLVPAPPVYAPGGPILLVFDVDSVETLAAIEQEAATAGATVSVVTQRPADTDLADLLTKARYARTTDFFEWGPER